MLLQAQEQQKMSDSVVAAEATQSLQAELRGSHVSWHALTMQGLVTFCWT